MPSFRRPGDLVEGDRWGEAMSGLRAQVEAQVPPGRSQRPEPGWVVPVLAAALLFSVVSPLAGARRGDSLRESLRNGTTRSETEIVGRFNASSGSKGGYVTRQSNIQTGSRAGGGAVYGCRGAPGGTEAGSAPCVRANNLAGGRAFEFASRSGPVGLFSVGSPSQTSTEPPFATNARGMVGNLNAELLGGSTREQVIAAASGTGGPPTGPAGGSLIGSYPNPGIGAGTVGHANLRGLVWRFGTGVSVPAMESRGAGADCEPGEVAISGGAQWNVAGNVNQNLRIRAFGVSGNASFFATAENHSNTSRVLTARVLCLAG